MRTTKLASFALISVLFLVLWGCGSSRDSSTSTTGDQTLASAPTVGINSCVSAQCHAVDTGAVAEWNEGVHANQENFPDTTYFGGDAAECTPCHDQAGDSDNLLEDGLFDPLDPKVERPVVGCESCHGGGQFHFGIVSGLPFATPDYDRCGQCHNETFDHNTHHPFADSIVENYKAGAHINSIEAAHATPESIRAKCGRCHSDEGFRLYYPLTMDYTRDELSAFMDPLPELTNVNPVQCRTCHDSHTGELRVDAVEDLNGQVYSSQFRTCTACHNVFIDAVFDAVANKFSYALDPIKLAADLDTDGGTDGRNNHYHGFFVDMVQTHFDNPDTMEVEGYNINAADENACLNCHDGHAATKFEQEFASGIATEWGNEEHFHGDYKQEAFNHGFDEGNAVCMECHNGTEAVKVIEGLEAADLDGQPGRVVACVTCHDLTAKSADGTAFELGARRQFKDMTGVTPTGDVTAIHTFESGQTVDLTGDEDNLLCLNCHSGRKAGSSVDEEIASEDLDDNGFADDGAYNFQNIHYRAAGASLFGNMAGGGYEFEGKVYASKFEHVDSNDLCIECHSAHDGKLFIASPGFGPTGCNTCHTNINIDPAVDYDGAIDQVRDIRMNGSFEDYDGNGVAEGIYYEVQGLKTVLLNAITASGVTQLGGYPYFSGISEASQLQAAYNYQVADKDPGSYAHNGDYIIQLLYDSIEEINAVHALGIDMSQFVREDPGHFASASEPFRHWDEDPTMSTSCARCHSSEGAIAFFNNGEVTVDDFKPYTRGISSGLACEACHTAPFDGTLRTQTAVTFPSDVVVDATTAGASEFFAAGNDSPLCMTCHQGRSSTDTLDARIAAGNLGFSNIHYYAAAASFFGNEVRGGYQYAGKSYSGTMSYPGIHDFPGYTTCEGCHMAGDPSHDFKPDIASCEACHGFAGPGADFQDLGDGVNEKYNNIQTLITDLYNDIQTYAAGTVGTEIVYDAHAYPYFFVDTNADGITDEAEVNFGNRYSSFDASLLRAAYNYQVGQKEPGSYIHNPDYMQQILFDSIEALGGTTTVSRPTTGILPP